MLVENVKITVKAIAQYGQEKPIKKSTKYKMDQNMLGKALIGFF